MGSILYILIKYSLTPLNTKEIMTPDLDVCTHQGLISEMNKREYYYCRGNDWSPYKYRHIALHAVINRLSSVGFRCIWYQGDERKNI